MLVLISAACTLPNAPSAGADPTSTAPVSGEPAATTPASTRQLTRVVVIVLENHEYSSIIGNSCCAYLNALAQKGTLFTNYHAITHPSLPNYLSMTSGSPQGKTGTDNTSPLINAPNLFAQLSARGIPWHAYEQTMPAPCYRGAFAGTGPGQYALKHDPAMMYQSISGTKLCQNAIPWTGVPASLPRFSFITPNECDDMHSCSPSVADAWVKNAVPGLLNRVGPHGRILITWDEGTTNVGGGGHIATILIGPGVPTSRVGTQLSHYSLLASLELLFHVPRLEGARRAPPLPLFLP